MKRTILPVLLGISIALALFSLAAIIYFRPPKVEKPEPAPITVAVEKPVEPASIEQKPEVLPSADETLQKPEPIAEKKPEPIAEEKPEPIAEAKPPVAPEPVVEPRQATVIEPVQIEGEVVQEIPVTEPVITPEPSAIVEPVVEKASPEPVVPVEKPVSKYWPKVVPFNQMGSIIEAVAPKKDIPIVPVEAIVPSIPEEPIVEEVVHPVAEEIIKPIAEDVIQPTSEIEKSEPVVQTQESLVKKTSPLVPKVLPISQIGNLLSEIEVKQPEAVVEVPVEESKSIRVMPQSIPLSSIEQLLKDAFGYKPMPKTPLLWTPVQKPADRETTVYVNPVSYQENATQMKQQAVDEILKKLNIQVWND